MRISCYDNWTTHTCVLSGTALIESTTATLQYTDLQLQKYCNYSIIYSTQRKLGYILHECYVLNGTDNILKNVA